MDANGERFILKLDDEVFLNLKQQIMLITDIKDFFNIRFQNDYPISDFKNYELDMYATITEFDD